MELTKLEKRREQIRVSQKEWRDKNKEKVQAYRQKYQANPDRREYNRLRQAERYAKSVAEKTGEVHKTRAQRKLEREATPETPEAREARRERQRENSRRSYQKQKLLKAEMNKQKVKTKPVPKEVTQKEQYENQIAQLENQILNHPNPLSPDFGELIRQLDIIQHKLDNLKK